MTSDRAALPGPTVAATGSGPGSGRGVERSGMSILRLGSERMPRFRGLPRGASMTAPQHPALHMVHHQMSGELSASASYGVASFDGIHRQSQSDAQLVLPQQLSLFASQLSGGLGGRSGGQLQLQRAQDLKVQNDWEGVGDNEGAGDGEEGDDEGGWEGEGGGAQLQEPSGPRMSLPQVGVRDVGGGGGDKIYVTLDSVLEHDELGTGGMPSTDGGVR